MSALSHFGLIEVLISFKFFTIPISQSLLTLLVFGHKTRTSLWHLLMFVMLYSVHCEISRSLFDVLYLLSLQVISHQQIWWPSSVHKDLIRNSILDGETTQNHLAGSVVLFLKSPPLPASKYLLYHPFLPLRVIPPELLPCMLTASYCGLTI